MAKICTKCNTENMDAELFCTECGAEFEIAPTEPPKRKRKPIVKQEQNIVIRNILLALIAASMILCLFACIQHISGSTLTLQAPVENAEAAKTIIFGNTWNTLSFIFQNISSFDFANSATVFNVFKILSQFTNSVCYLLMVAVMGLTGFMIFKKHPKAGLLAVISGGFGLVIIVLGFLIGYFFIVNNTGLYYLRSLPQLTVLPLLPLLIEMPIFGLMLAKKEPKDK